MDLAPAVPRFAPHSALRADLIQRVDAYFEETGLPRHGGAAIRWKSAAVMAWFVGTYLLLLLWADSWATGVPLAISLGLAVAGIGFTIQHDGGHGAYARGKHGNRFAAYALDLVGASSYVWDFKHAVVHHTATNVAGADDDIDAAPFLRLAPDQPRRWYHRLQHFYAWPLLTFLVPKWNFWDDFAALVRGRVGRLRLPRPRRMDLAVFVGGKVAFAAWAFVLPLVTGHRLLDVLGIYALAMGLAGVWLSIVFQLAHCVEEAEFPTPDATTARIDRPFVEHQLATTVDFAPRNRVLTWYLGGLNFQVEHHLFPQVSHIHYPALWQIVRDTCADHGVEHRSTARFRSAIASHVRHLRNLGRKPTAILQHVG